MFHGGYHVSQDEKFALSSKEISLRHSCLLTSKTFDFERIFLIIVPFKKNKILKFHIINYIVIPILMNIIS